MRYIPIILLLACLSGCVTFPYWEKMQEKKQINVDEITQVVLYHTADMKEEHELQLCDSLVCYQDSINKIKLYYSSQRAVTVKEARQTVVDFVEGFLDAILFHPIIGPQLAEGFDEKNIELCINYESYFVRFIDPYMVGSVYVNDGVVTFYAGDLKEIQRDEWHLRREYYTLSRTMVEVERQIEMEQEAEEVDFEEVKKMGLFEVQ